MASTARVSNGKKLEVVEAVAALARGRLCAGPAAEVERFVRLYHAGVAAEDLCEREVADLYGAALALFALVRERRPAELKLRVYNPVFEEHGWQSTHTIVELCTDDMPFLVDSLVMELGRGARAIHFMVHPILHLVRDARGTLLGIAEPMAEGARAESIIHVEIDRETDPVALAALRDDLTRVLCDVRTAVEDWPGMRAVLARAIESFAPAPSETRSGSRIEELRAFLEWLSAGNFTLLGCRDHVRDAPGADLLPVAGSGLGIWRDPAAGRAARPGSEHLGPARDLGRVRSAPLAVTPMSVAPAILTPVVITKASLRSTVHRPSYLDYIGVRRFGDGGSLLGEMGFLGLHVSAVYQGDPETIPILRHKIKGVVRRAAFAPGGHSARALRFILESYPRDELFQISEDELFDTAMGILHLQERQRVRLFVRRDPYGGFLSCLVFVPRDRYNTDLRERMQGILREAVNAFEVDFNVSLAESPLARIHFMARTRPEEVPAFDIVDIEARLAEATRSWADRLHEALVEARGEETGNDLFRRYCTAFPAAYREDHTARHAAHDIARVEAALATGTIELHLANAGPGMLLGGADDLLAFKLYHPAASVTLSHVLPMLENMGVTVVDDRPYEIRALTGSVWIHAFRLRHNEAQGLDTDQVRAEFQEAFALVWSGAIDNDGFNRLVLRARLDAYEILVLRTYARYLRQIGLPLSQSYIEDCLARHPDTARALIGLFEARFDPRRKARAARVSALAAEIEETLEATTSLDEDRILRGLLTVIQATLRTNYFQRGPNGERRSHMAIKLDPGLIPRLPCPLPMFEVFVCSADVEAVHLRGGQVARGGIRWSDRREDFRTEVLGLMKAQRVKNVVIVPVGAKGGFIVKRPPAAGGREALQQMAVHCYRTFIRGLLDVADNRVGQRIVPPRDTVRYDGDDPYLVVAADKGTATFSDIANALALERGFWLGDAFASGGSAGYDHKKMGITARGAFEAVKHHFADLGVDVEREPVTVVGIGDMGGDVFGNGMLLSRHIKLVGAFNHQHIFLDPNPDPERSFGERRRLFEGPGSSWSDYDPASISPGGGVWPRSAKSIPVSAEARAVLGIENKSLLPSDLIRALLKAPVDLLWNGGIGTFVKASGESHAEAGDRTNDAIRVDGRDLRCKVVGEGGNLGLTQRGRIEYALNGGRINTDSIDNCGGVNCSDHEVNIKILLNAAVAEGDLTGKQRDRLIAEMTDEVGALVVKDSYRLARALTVAELDAERHLGWYKRLMRELEQEGLLERALECLPEDGALAERQAAGHGLTRPELSVLSAYAKMDLYAEVLRSDMPDDAYLSGVLERYFPQALRERFPKEILGHRLGREIIATVATNSMVNRAGSTFGLRLRELTGMPLPAIAKAYMAARDIFQVRGLWDELDRTEARVSRAARVLVVRETQTLLERGTRWLLHRSPESFEITELVARFTPAVEALGAVLPVRMAASPVSDGAEIDAEWFRQEGVGEELAARLAGLRRLICALDLGELAGQTGVDLAVAGGVYFAIERRLGIDALRERIGLGDADFWQERARTNLEDELAALGAALAAAALASEADPERLQAMDPKAVVERWAGAHGAALDRYDRLMDEMKALEAPGLAMLTVALGELRGLVRCPRGSASISGDWTASGQHA